MSDYGCCTMSICVHEDDYESCEECPFYDKDFFKEYKSTGLVDGCKVCQQDECFINKDMGKCPFEITGGLRNV